MNKSLKPVLFWTPRIAGILFILFISLFALDVFDMGLGLWGTVVALFIHLIPSILLTAAILIAWRQAWAGTVGFIGWGVWYLLSARGFGWEVYVLIAGIPVLIGFLFLADWIWRKQREKT
jgi:hypothetical protein